MKVMLFFDGKNFYKGFLHFVQQRSRNEHFFIHFTRLAEWLVQQVGGTSFRGAYYYTATDPQDPEQRGVENFLKSLELEPGFFVIRLEKRTRSLFCPECNAHIPYTQEKGVDTRMVADMLQLAAVHAYDTLVLMSGDADFTPAVEAIHRLGKVVYIATWGEHGLSPQLRSAAFSHLDLIKGTEFFLRSEEGTFISREEPDPERYLPTFLEALERAENHFQHGYVGLSFFLNRWKDPWLPEDPQLRRLLLERAVERGLVEIYDAPETGDRAVRRVTQENRTPDLKEEGR